MKPRIVFIGSGNVAWHLAKAFDKSCDILQVYSPTLEHARRLAMELQGAQAISQIESLQKDADIYLVCIKDDAIASILEKTSIRHGIWLHTSGCTDIGVLKGKRDRYGVLYPLQTFTKESALNLEDTPFFIEACDEDTLERIKELAGLISNDIHTADSQSRRLIHVAAVFASNFANHLWTQADQIMTKAGYRFEALLPLIKATLAKAAEISPEKGQTGPARRCDTGTMSQHLSLLDANQASLYKALSQSIMNYYNITIGNEQHKL